MKCLAGFQNHLLVTPVTTEGFITRSEKMLFPCKPLSKSVLILLCIPRRGARYGSRISTGQCRGCPVLEPGRRPEETNGGTAVGYTATAVPKQEGNARARSRGGCTELRHTEASVWRFHRNFLPAPLRGGCRSLQLNAKFYLHPGDSSVRQG